MSRMSDAGDRLTVRLNSTHRAKSRMAFERALMKMAAKRSKLMMRLEAEKAAGYETADETYRRVMEENL